MLYIISIFTCLLISSSSAQLPFIFNQHYYESNFIYDYDDMFNDFNIVKENNQKFGPDDVVCRDQITGEALDWLTLYKLPKKSSVLESSPVENPFIYHGTAYTYMTNKAQEKWHLSKLSMNDTDSFAGKTLDILYKNFGDSKTLTNSKLGYILYNDQADKVTLERGHTKGVIMFNDKTAIWIVHSIPHFPPKPSDSKYQIHSSQCVYGQQFFCMTVKLDALKKIGEQLKYTYPQVYDYHIPKSIQKSPYLENLLSVVNGDHIKSEPWFNLNTFTTIGGEKLLSFAKFTNFHDDLYAALIAPHFEANLFAETWNNGRGTLESNCSTKLNFQVHNIEQIKFDNLDIRFSVHHDHSKWTVTTDKDSNLYFDNFLNSKKIACIGDINRQEEQYKRAGGTVCFLKNENIWNQYANLVDQVEPCKRNFISRSSDKIKYSSQGKRIRYEKNSKDKIVMLG